MADFTIQPEVIAALRPLYIDAVVARSTAFKSFAELMDGTHKTYRPSIDTRVPEMVELADAYDAEMPRRGDKRRAYRYGGRA